MNRNNSLPFSLPILTKPPHTNTHDGLSSHAEKCKGWPSFVMSICCIGVLTAVIGDVAAHFGCVSQIKEQITAITVVSLGTSVPGMLTNI